MRPYTPPQPTFIDFSRGRARYSEPVRKKAPYGVGLVEGKLPSGWVYQRDLPSFKANQ